jgi:hypothetical protein
MRHFETAAEYLQSHDVRLLSDEDFSGMSELLIHELSFIVLKKIWQHSSNPLALESKIHRKTDDDTMWRVGHNIGRYITLELIEAAYVKTEQGPYTANTQDWAQAALEDYAGRDDEYKERRRYGNLGHELAEKTGDIMKIGANAIVHSGELHLPTTFTYRHVYMTAIATIDEVAAHRTTLN